MKKAWKIFKFCIEAGTALFILSLAAVVLMAYIRRPIGKADAAIVLGAAINTPALYNRSLEGLRLYHEGKTNVLILSGGRISDKDISEAQYMKSVILKNSSSAPVIILEENSHSTFENISNSKKLAPNARSVIIVSDTYHLARGAAVARAAGFSPVYWSSPNSASYYPSGELIYHYFREAAALIAYVPKLVLY